MPETCPQCIGDVENDVGQNRWIITFSTTTSVAQYLDDSTFKLDAILDDDTPVEEELPERTGVESNGRVYWDWEITSPGDPVSATMTVDHSVLGSVETIMTINGQQAAA